MRRILSRDEVLQLMVKQGVVTVEQLKYAGEESKKSGVNVFLVLSLLEYTTQLQTVEIFSHLFKLGKYFDQQRLPSLHKKELVKLMPFDIVWKYDVCPISFDNGKLEVAVFDPTPTNLYKDLESMTGKRVILVLTSQGKINELIYAIYRDTVEWLESEDLYVESFGKDVLPERMFRSAAKGLINLILVHARRENYSELEFIRTNKGLSVFASMYTTPVEFMIIPNSYVEIVLAVIKQMAGLSSDLTEFDQAGEFEFSAGGQMTKATVAILPSARGDEVQIELHPILKQVNENA